MKKVLKGNDQVLMNKTTQNKQKDWLVCKC